MIGGHETGLIVRDEFKFSSFYLKVLNTLLGRTRDVLKVRDTPAEENAMNASLFIIVHAILAGLSMW